MAVSENDLVVGPLTPAAGVTTISLDFYFEQASWLEVYKSGSETPLVLNTDYTVTGAGSSSGVVTLTAPANGTDAYSVYLSVPLERSSDMQLRGEFKSEPFNIEMDRIWQRLQRHWTEIQRALRVTRTAGAPNPLEPVASRLVGLDAGGNLTTYTFSPFSTDADAAIIYDSVDALEASAEAARGVGSVWRAGPYRYQEESSGFSTPHIVTAAGVRLTVLPDADGKVNIMAFSAVADGDSGTPTDNTTAFTRAMATGRKIIIPDGVFYCASQITFTADFGGFEGLATPVVDFSNNTFTSGSIIKGLVTAQAGRVGISLKNIGVDSKASSLTEGIVITQFKGVTVEDVTVLGSNENNHCCLIQEGTFLTVRNFRSLGGKQGLAVKAKYFTIDGVDSWDTTVYGFTFRYDTVEGRDGVIRNVRCRNNLLTSPKSGGFVLMNDDVDGAAMQNIFLEHILCDDTKTGIFLLNNLGNNTPMERVVFRDVILRNIPNYAFQTYGTVQNIEVDGILFQNCNGAFYNNLDPGVNNLRLRNVTYDNVTFGSSLSGSDHQLSNWRKIGGGGTWGQNASANLQTSGMDASVGQFSNITNAGGTGSFLGGASGVTLPASGSLYAVSRQTDQTKQINQSMALDDTVTIHTMPDNFGVIEVTAHVLSSLGRHVAKYLITGQVATKIAGNAFADAHFIIGVSGTDVFLQYKDATTRNVAAQIVYNSFEKL